MSDGKKVQQDSSLMLQRYTEMDYNESNSMPTAHTQMTDTTAYFQTDQIFSSREVLVEWAREIGRQNYVVVVIGRSDFRTGAKGRKDKVLLGCEKSGKYRPKPGSTNLGASSKCECPFRLKGIPLATGEGWTLRVVCGFHNNELARTLVGHSFSGRLIQEQKQIVHDLTKNHVKPKQILTTLKNHPEYAACHTTIEHIYNERHLFKKSLRGPRTELQHLLLMLERDRFVCQYRRLPDSDIVGDIFWAHPDSIIFLNTFNLVLMIDDTFKTNKHNLLLMEIVGVTSTDQTYLVGFAFLSGEQEGNFVWALEKLKDCFWRPDLYPKVILTDREIALMRAVALVFPTSANMLCRWHIGKCVYAKIKLSFPGLKDTWSKLKSAWDFIVYADTETAFLDSVQVFERLCIMAPNLFKYVTDTWIVEHKEKFVSLWIDRHMHLGNYTTNRVEGAHSKLKRMLMDCKGDLVTVWDSMKSNLSLEHNKIMASFERHKNRLQAQHCNNYFLKHLVGYVSRDALDLVLGELSRANTTGIDSSICGCVIRITHGLPCACEVARYLTMHAPIPLETIHPHWKRLYMGIEEELRTQQGLVTVTPEEMNTEWDLIMRHFHLVDIGGKQSIYNSVREISRPDTTSMCAPKTKVATKGAPKKGSKGKGKANEEDSTRRDPSWFEHVNRRIDETPPQSGSAPSSLKSTARKRRRLPYLDQIPAAFQPFVEDIIDVEGDGNCGYRALAVLQGKAEDYWPVIRSEVSSEIRLNSGMYRSLWGDRFHEVKDSVVHGIGYAPPDKWMSLPDLGYCIATRYRVVLVALSPAPATCFTFLPLRGPPPCADVHMFCIAFVNTSHWVIVKLKEDCPLPSFAPQWMSNCLDSATKWATKYVLRTQRWSFIFLRGTLEQQNETDPIILTDTPATGFKINLADP